MSAGMTSATPDWDGSQWASSERLHSSDEVPKWSLWQWVGKRPDAEPSTSCSCDFAQISPLPD